MFLFQLPWLAEYVFHRDPVGMFQRIFRGQARRKEMFPDDVIAVFTAAMMKPNAFWAGIQYYRASFSISTIKEFIRFPKISTPTMVIWGDRDVALGIELCDDLEKQMAGPYRFHRIQGCSHWVQQEEPETVNQFLLEFLSESR
jgi:pimeloyl-ACP methyl ester carboxylesterase